jgi:mRNA interferase MazF
MTRGELWWIDLGLPFGSEPGYKRPVLIIQNDYFNISNINTTVIVPLTTNTIYAEAPGNIFISREDSKLTKDSVIVISQIKVIDKSRLIKKISKVNKAIITEIEENLLFVLGIIRM